MEQGTLAKNEFNFERLSTPLIQYCSSGFHFSDRNWEPETSNHKHNIIDKRQSVAIHLHSYICIVQVDINIVFKGRLTIFIEITKPALE